MTSNYFVVHFMGLTEGEKLALPADVESDPTSYEVAVRCHNITIKPKRHQYPIGVLCGLVGPTTYFQKAWLPVVGFIVPEKMNADEVNWHHTPLWFPLVSADRPFLSLTRSFDNKPHANSGFIIFQFRKRGIE